MDISFPHGSGAGYPPIATTDKRFSSADIHFIADSLAEVSGADLWLRDMHLEAPPRQLH